MLGCLSLLAGCASAIPPAREIPAPPDPFTLTFWCGPPLAELDDARAAEIAAAGFDVIGPPCEGKIDEAGNLRALETAHRYGLGVWVSDPRFAPSAAHARDWPEPVRAAVAAYAGHPALAGYFVTDEPTPAELSTVAAVTRELHARDPARLAYVNLLPDYAFESRPDYERYLARAANELRPELLSYDYYPLLRSGDRPGFFEGLSRMRASASEHGAPFLLIVQAMPHGDYRNPTAAELSWQAFHALAYGARGISYFAYWTPVHVERAAEWHFRKGLIERGQPTAHYYEAQRLNPQLRAVGNALSGYRSVAVADSAAVGPLASVEGGPVTVGSFERPGSPPLALVVNREHSAAVSVRLVAARNGTVRNGTVEELDLDRRTWSLVDLTTPLALPPGGARLLRFGRHGA